MKQLILSILCMVGVASGVACGQRLETNIKVHHTNFSGKWLYNFDESGPKESKIQISVKRFVAIQQDGTQITVTMNPGSTYPELPTTTQVIFTDGRSQNLSSDLSERGFSATNVWEDGKLVTRIYDKSKKLVNRNEIELLANGKKLRLYGWHIDSLERIFEENSIFDRVQQ